MVRLLSSLVVLTTLTPLTALAGEIQSSIKPENLIEAKVTPPNKYLSSKDAFHLLKDDPDIFFVDVRDPIEISHMGHPALIDAIVPLRVQTEKFDKGLGEYSLQENPQFLNAMYKAIKVSGKSKHDMIIVTCGSGYRSAEAVRKLVKAGYTNVWHIPDGYAGDEKPGLNTHNAWNLAKLPWSHSIIHGSEWIKLLDE